MVDISAVKGKPDDTIIYILGASGYDVDKYRNHESVLSAQKTLRRYLDRIYAIFGCDITARNEHIIDEIMKLRERGRMTKTDKLNEINEINEALTNLLFELAEAGIYELQEDVSPEGYHAVARAANKLDGLVYDYRSGNER